MTSRDFAYWLQGFFEVSARDSITKEQTTIIKNHLNLVFLHEIDKQYKPGDGSQQVHDGLAKPPKQSFPESEILRC